MDAGKTNLKKEYRPLHGTDLTVLGAAVCAFTAIPEINTIIITVPDDPDTGEKAARNALPPLLLEKNAVPRLYFVSGGQTRQASVSNALTFLAKEFPVNPPGYVLIHDGARPWISASLIKKIITEVKIHHAVIPLLPITETPKLTDQPLEKMGNSPIFIKQNLKRVFTGTAQTPQAFVFPEILIAHEKAASQKETFDYTDDAEVWSAFCGPVAVIPGETQNKKITFPEDI